MLSSYSVPALHLSELQLRPNAEDSTAWWTMKAGTKTEAVSYCNWMTAISKSSFPPFFFTPVCVCEEQNNIKQWEHKVFDSETA